MVLSWESLPIVSVAVSRVVGKNFRDLQKTNEDPHMVNQRLIWKKMRGFPPFPWEFGAYARNSMNLPLHRIIVCFYKECWWRKAHSQFSRLYRCKKMQHFLYNQVKTITLIRPVEVANLYLSESVIAFEFYISLDTRKKELQIYDSSDWKECQYVKGLHICCSGHLYGTVLAKSNAESILKHLHM